MIHNIYGLKQAGLLWYSLIDQVITSFGFKRAVYDPCTYEYHDVEKRRMIIGIFVDDIVLFSNDNTILDSFKNHLQINFKKITFKGPLKTFLGIELNLLNEN